MLMGGRQPLQYAKERSKTAAALAGLSVRSSTRLPTINDSPIDVVVCLTSYSGRLAKVHVTLASLLAQSVRPAHLILVLSLDELGTTELPARLAKLVDHGVELVWVEQDSGSYKKLIPALGRFPDSVIVTADDDVIYPRTWLEDLLRAHHRHPADVVCHRGLEMVPRADGSGYQPYAAWPRASPATPARLVFPTGVGGVLYPARSLDARVVDLDAAIRVCPRADDVWFKVMALLNGTNARIAGSRTRDFPSSRLGGAGPALSDSNVVQGENDQQIRRALDEYGTELRIHSS